MRHWARQLLRLHTGRGLIALFTVTMFLPGILLAVFGVRALYQERRLADQQIRERLERATDRPSGNSSWSWPAGSWLWIEPVRLQRLDHLSLPPDAARNLAESPGSACS